MGQPQIRKLQVCDRCCGRFGMVTHRWWGYKFCKRTCKEAHVREVTLGREVIGRWLGTVRVSHWMSVPDVSVP
jgi:hypothetical protein